MHLLQKQFFAFGSSFRQSSKLWTSDLFFWLAIFRHFVRNVLENNVLSQIPCFFFFGIFFSNKQKNILKLPKT
jgi:hypothetical protein